MIEGGMPKGSRKEKGGFPIRPGKSTEQPRSEADQAAVELATLKANESARHTADQAPYDDVTLEGDMETSGAFRAAATEEGDVPSWDAADLKESVMAGMGMAPELDTTQHRFGDPRALNMVQAVDVPATKKPAQERGWKLKNGSVEVDIAALGLSEADIFSWPPNEQVNALKKELDPADVNADDERMSDTEILAEQEARAAKGHGPEGKQAVGEAVQELEAMLPAKKERTLNGILNLGLYVSEWKSDKMAELIKDSERKTEEGSALNRFLSSVRELYQRRSKSSRQLMERNDKMMSLSGALTGASKVGSILSWGRVGLDIVGHGAFAKQLNPFRHATAAAMAFGTGAEVAKEMRLKNAEVRSKTRIEDAGAAEDEARALYEEAKQKAGGKVSAESLSAVYQERLPKDLLARLQANPDGVATSFVGKILQKDMLWGVARIQKNLDAIDADKKLDDAQKAAKRQQLTASYGAFLRDADRMLTRSAGVDAMSYAARLAEKGAKAFVTVMAVDTIARLFVSAHEIVGNHFGQPENAFHGIPAGALAGVTESRMPLVGEESLTESSELPPGIVSLETVGAGGSITGSLMKQLEEHPEKFGYAGNPRSSEELHAWAFRSAKQMAKSAGFLNRKDQQDSWLSAAAVGKLQIGVNMGHGSPELAFVDQEGNVITSADVKAGRYAMEVPFADKGERTAIVSPEQRPAPAVAEDTEEERPKAAPLPKPRPVPPPVREQEDIAALVPKEAETPTDLYTEAYAQLPEQGMVSRKTLALIMKNISQAAAERDRQPVGSPLRKAADAYLARAKETVQTDFGKYVEKGWFSTATANESAVPTPAVEDAPSPARTVRRVVRGGDTPRIVETNTTTFEDEDTGSKGTETRTETSIDVSSWSIEDVERKLASQREMLAGQERAIAANPGSRATRMSADFSRRIIADLERALTQKKKS